MAREGRGLRLATAYAKGVQKGFRERYDADLRRLAERKDLPEEAFAWFSK